MSASETKNLRNLTRLITMHAGSGIALIDIIGRNDE